MWAIPGSDLGQILPHICTPPLMLLIRSKFVKYNSSGLFCSTLFFQIRIMPNYDSMCNIRYITIDVTIIVFYPVCSTKSQQIPIYTRLSTVLDNYQPINVLFLFRLFHQVTVDPATWSPTYTRFAALLDNYQPITRMEEESSFSKTTEIDSFLDAIIKTDVFRYLEDFLVRKGTNSQSIPSVQSCGKSILSLTLILDSPQFQIKTGTIHIFSGCYKSDMRLWISWYPNLSLILRSIQQEQVS